MRIIHFVIVALFIPSLAFSQANVILRYYSGNNLLKIAGDQYNRWPVHADALNRTGFHPVDTIGKGAPEVYWSDSPQGSLVFKVRDKLGSDDELLSIIITDKSTMELPLGIKWNMNFDAVLNAVKNMKGVFNITSSKSSFPEIDFSYQDSGVLSSVVKVHWEEDEGIVHKGRYLEISPVK